LYPPEVGPLPHVGYYRQLSAEGLLSLRPGLVIAPADAGPPEVIAQVRAAGVPVALLPADATAAGARQRLVLLRTLLDRPDAASAAVARTDAELRAVVPARGAPRVLFVYTRGAGSVQVAGADTAASEMIRLAGGVNAIDGWTGYRPLTTEGVVA